MRAPRGPLWAELGAGTDDASAEATGARRLQVTGGQLLRPGGELADRALPSTGSRGPVASPRRSRELWRADYATATAPMTTELTATQFPTDAERHTLGGIYLIVVVRGQFAVYVPEPCHTYPLRQMMRRELGGRLTPATLRVTLPTDSEDCYDCDDQLPCRLHTRELQESRLGS